VVADTEYDTWRTSRGWRRGKRAGKQRWRRRRNYDPRKPARVLLASNASLSVWLSDAGVGRGKSGQTVACGINANTDVSSKGNASASSNFNRAHLKKCLASYWRNDNYQSAHHSVVEASTHGDQPNAPDMHSCLFQEAFKSAWAIQRMVSKYSTSRCLSGKCAKPAGRAWVRGVGAANGKAPSTHPGGNKSGSRPLHRRGDSRVYGA